MALHCTAQHNWLDALLIVTYGFYEAVVADWLECIDGFPLFNVLISLAVRL